MNNDHIIVVAVSRHQCDCPSIHEDGIADILRNASTATTVLPAREAVAVLTNRKVHTAPDAFLPEQSSFCSGTNEHEYCDCAEVCICGHVFDGHLSLLGCVSCGDRCNVYDATCVTCGEWLLEGECHVCPELFRAEYADIFGLARATASSVRLPRKPEYLSRPVTSPVRSERVTAGQRWWVACCGDFIQSESVHDLVWCRCRDSFVDGGSAYDRFGTSGKHTVKETFFPDDEDSGSAEAYHTMFCGCED